MVIIYSKIFWIFKLLVTGRTENIVCMYVCMSMIAEIGILSTKLSQTHLQGQQFHVSLFAQAQAQCRLRYWISEISVSHNDKRVRLIDDWLDTGQSQLDLPSHDSRVIYSSDNTARKCDVLEQIVYLQKLRKNAVVKFDKM